MKEDLQIKTKKWDRRPFLKTDNTFARLSELGDFRYEHENDDDTVTGHCRHAYFVDGRAATGFASRSRPYDVHLFD